MLFYLTTERAQNEKHVQQLQLEATQTRERLAEQQTEKQRVQEHLHELNNEMSSKIAQLDSLQRNVCCAEQFLCRTLRLDIPQQKHTYCSFRLQAELKEELLTQTRNELNAMDAQYRELSTKLVQRNELLQR